jgi:hypothetical protein
MAQKIPKKKPESLKSALTLDSKVMRTKDTVPASDASIFIIGFDTEYEKSDSTDEDEAKSNRVLSYQYCGQMVDEDGEQADRKWSGIIYPKGPTVEDRLTIPEFLHHVIQDGLKQYPELTFPPNLYLIAHFTRADVPGFREFKDKTLRDRLLLQNIRSLFMNLESPFVVEFQSHTEGKPVELKVSFRDTMTLAPTGLRSLDDLGKLLGIQKLKLSDDPEREYFYKTHMGQLLHDDRDLFERYAIRDAEICAAYAADMIRASITNLDTFALPTTLSSKGLKLLRKFWSDNHVDELAIVGKEEVEELVWSTKANRSFKRKNRVNLPAVEWNESFLTEAYHGGRGEQFWFGPAPEGIWYDYDLASAYPSAMTLIGTPDWSKFHTVADIDELLSDKFSSSDLVFANVDFEFPETVLYPVLPVRTTFGLIFPRKGNSTTHISEIRLAHRLGCKLTLIEAKHVKTIDGGDPGKPATSIRPFADFAKYCVDRRSEFPKNSLQNLMWKEIVNSTYGKTGQGLRERRVYDLRDADTKLLPPSVITNPAFASFITAFCRGVLGEIMNALPQGVSIFSVTTDGFLTTASPDQMQAATNGELCQFYKRARAYLSGKSDIYEVKHVIRRPIGWRTRGQATLVPSRPEDWNGAGATYSEDGSYVLAKGGIKLNGRLSKAEQNQEILDLFANRKPDDVLHYSIGLGIRDMYEEGSDFVDKAVEKKLSMEFDWKRRPTNPKDADTTGSPLPCKSHLSFGTVPWDDVRQFNWIRDIWGQFRKSSPRCLKTVHDLKVFSDHYQNTTSLDSEAGKHLRREDGVMKRLRQQIAVAQGARAAGTHIHNGIPRDEFTIISEGKLTAKLLSRFLDDVIGIPCKQDDIANARRTKVFNPGQVPNTTEAREKLALLKATLFPELKIDEFLAKNEAVSLIK